MPPTKTELKAINAAVGANLRNLRRIRGLTQGKLAEDLGITFQQVQKYENGSNRISASRLVAACRVLSCTIADVFAGTPADDATSTLPDLPAALLTPEGRKLARDLAKMTGGQRRSIANVAAAIVAPPPRERITAGRISADKLTFSGDVPIATAAPARPRQVTR